MREFQRIRPGTLTRARQHVKASALALSLAGLPAWSAPEPLTPPTCVAPPFTSEGKGVRSHPRLRIHGPTRAPSFDPLRATGTLHVLVILAEFDDRPHRIPAARFAEHLFGGTPSLRDYYDEASGGRLTITGDIHGWIPLPASQANYSQGEGGIGAYPTNGQKMAEDAVRAAIDAGLDLGSYDATGDGFVDALLVVHSGQGLEWCSNATATPEPDDDAINSHQWIVRESTYPGQSTRVRDYFTCPELQLVRPIVAPAWSDSIATIGVFCHELGHMMGLPDFYDTQTGANHAGVWDIMDYGSWNPIGSPAMPPGAMPSHFSAWSRVFLGWSNPETLAPAVGETIVRTVSMDSASLTGSAAQLLGNPGGVNWTRVNSGDGEYFLAESRTRSGYDAGLPGEGLLIFHVDEGRRSNDAEDNFDGAGLLQLAPQDGVVGIAPSDSRGDPWPGAQSTFGPSSDPDSRLFNGDESGVTLTSIRTSSGGVVTFDATVVHRGTPSPLPYARPNPWRPRPGEPIDLVLRGDGDPVASGTRVVLHDLAGRTLRVLGDEALDPSRRIAHWDGRTGSDRRPAGGVIFFRIDEPHAPTRTGRLVLLR